VGVNPPEEECFWTKGKIQRYRLFSPNEFDSDNNVTIKDQTPDYGSFPFSLTPRSPRSLFSDDNSSSNEASFRVSS